MMCPALVAQTARPWFAHGSRCYTFDDGWFADLQIETPIITVLPVATSSSSSYAAPSSVSSATLATHAPAAIDSVTEQLFNDLIAVSRTELRSFLAIVGSGDADAASRSDTFCNRDFSQLCRCTARNHAELCL